MDWVWRIGFFIIIYFIGQALADVKLVTPNYSSGRVDEKAALLNALLPSIIIAFDALPLVMKVFRKRKTNVIVNKPTNFSDSHLSEPLNNVPEADDKISAAQKRKDDEKLYQAVAEELSRDEKNEGLWLKAMAETDGDENKTKARYVEFRIQSLKDEKELAAQKSTQNVKTKKGGHKSEKATSDTQMSIETIMELLSDMNYTVTKTPIGFTIKEPMGAKVRIETEEKLLQYFRQKKSNRTGDKVQVNVALLIEDLEKLKYRVKRKGNGFVVKEPLGGKAFLSSSYELECYLKQKTNNK